MAALESERSDAEFVITSRYPTSSAHILGRPVVDDIFSGRLIEPGRFPDTRRRLIPWRLMARHRTGHSLWDRVLPAPVRERIEIVAGYDLVVHVGGSNFVDLYGNGHFETDFAAMIAGVPVILPGHSIGPVAQGRYPVLMRHLLKHVAYVGLRESASRRLLEAADMPMTRVHGGADTAWNIDPFDVPHADPQAEFFSGSNRPLVAITARTLAPFDGLLGIDQSSYERAFAGLVDRLIEAGYDVLALATCTGIDSYHRDDRMVALRIGQQVSQPAHFRVAMNEFDDLALGARLRGCELLVATRLHSAIIAMNFGTPALTLAYEHKSRGMLEDMGLSDLSAEMSELIEGTFAARVLAVLGQRHAWAGRIAEPVAQARARARRMVCEALASVGLAA